MRLVQFAFFYIACVRGLSLAGPGKIIGYLCEGYTRSLHVQPLLTNIATASALSVVADGISQSIEISGSKKAQSSRSEDPDPSIGVETIASTKFSAYRSFCISVYGGLVYGWLISYWFKFLNFLVPQQGITFSKIALKVAINQSVMSPGLNSLFFAYVIFVRDLVTPLNVKLQLLKKKLAADLVPTMLRSCLYWGTVQFFNFAYIPTNYQLLYTNIAFVMWTTYVSFIGYKKV